MTQLAADSIFGEITTLKPLPGTIFIRRPSKSVSGARVPIVQNQRFFNTFVDAIYIRTNHVSDINISSAIFTFVSFEAIFYVNVILQKKQK